jgi:endonuclease/exonuclease/phosphatase family metal-dependent hydrolase
LRVVATHLGLSVHERRAQTRTLMSLAGKEQTTMIIMGDFNDWFWPGSVRRVLSRVCPARTRFRTFPSWLPLLRLDRIYCRPQGAFVECFTDRAGRLYSDHLPVIADVVPGQHHGIARPESRSSDN